MEANQMQTLVILGEERVARRLAEDYIESLSEKITQLEDEIRLANEAKRILMADVGELTEKVTRLEEGAANVA